MKKSTRYWLWGSICIFIINISFFIFRNDVDPTFFLWIVILTPVACLVLYPLTCLLDKERLPVDKRDA